MNRVALLIAVSLMLATQYGCGWRRGCCRSCRPACCHMASSSWEPLIQETDHETAAPSAPMPGAQARIQPSPIDAIITPALRVPRKVNAEPSNDKPGFCFPEEEADPDVARRPHLPQLNQPLQSAPDLY